MTQPNAASGIRARLWRWTKRLVMVLLLLMLVAIAVIYFGLRRSLPALNGTLSVGVSAATQIERDALGTATISASSRADAYFAQGFVHAQERYFEMDLSRRSAAGELSELFGAVALERDQAIRVHRMRAQVQRALKDLTAADRTLLQRYVDGVNAGLKQLSSKPWAYVLLASEPKPWLLEDSLLVGVAMSFNLQDHHNSAELAADTAKAALPESVYRYLYFRTSQSFDAPLQAGDIVDPAMPSAQDLNLRELPDAWFQATGVGGTENVRGSNNWAVSSALTKSVDGKNPAMLANDMHLNLGVPSIWFRQRLRYPLADGRQIDVVGVGLPGVPGTIVGSNRLVAWGITNSYGDWMDFVRLLPSGTPDQYLTATGTAPITTVLETIKVKNAADVQLGVRETRFGPVEAKDINGHELALAWVAGRAGGLNINVMNFELATDAQALLDIAQSSGMPHSNMVVADANGKVAWGLGGRLPLRASARAQSSITDSNQLADDIWIGFAVQNPRVSDPVDGRIWTANSRVVAGTDLQLVGDGGYALGARSQQIHQRLLANEQFTEADFLSIQLDSSAPVLDRWWLVLTKLVENRNGQAEVAELISKWNRSADADSVAYRIVRNWRLEVLKQVNNGLSAPIRKLDPSFNLPIASHSEAIVWPIVESRAMHLLPKPYADWDALLLASLQTTLQQMQAQGPLAKRTWGEQNRVAITHPLARAVPQLDWFLGMRKEPQHGDGGTIVRASGPAFGASERLVVRPGLEEQGLFHMPGGQSGHPLSPFYGAGHQDWLVGKPTPLLPGVSEYRLTLQP
jgi:penicillin G amidase